jgi:hypothetical protein
LELKYQDVLGGVGFVEFQTGVAADLPNEVHRADAGDGRRIDKLEVFE